MKSIGIAVVSLVAAFVCSAKAGDGIPGQAPAPPIIRAIELRYPGASKAERERFMKDLRPLIGRPYSADAERIIVEELYKFGNISNFRILGEPIGDGVKVDKH